MVPKNYFKKIKEFILNRYKNNIVAILVFGSANTGEYKIGKSDIDTIIILKGNTDLDLKQERKLLIKELKSVNLSIQNFVTVKDIKKYVKERNSWGIQTAILSEGGSKIIYSNEEFIKLKNWFKINFSSKEKIKDYFRKKDEFELYGYFKNLECFELIKNIFAHIRKKIQAINYFENNISNKLTKEIINYQAGISSNFPVKSSSSALKSIPLALQYSLAKM